MVTHGFFKLQISNSKSKGGQHMLSLLHHCKQKIPSSPTRHPKGSKRNVTAPICTFVLKFLSPRLTFLKG